MVVMKCGSTANWWVALTIPANVTAQARFVRQPLQSFIDHQHRQQQCKNECGDALEADGIGQHAGQAAQ